jgi:hypothetical protein
MKNQLIMLAACASLAITACKKDASLDLNANKNTAAADISINGKTKVTLSADINVSDTLTADNVYEIVGQIGVRSNATLTIEPGTVIYGREATGTTATTAPGALIIDKGSKLIAIGTETNPIVFTSFAKVDNNATTSPKAGDFGGVVILGNAPSNVTSLTAVEGVAATLSWAKYGLGSSATENSGTLQYIRIEYAGFAIEADKEINGLTFAAVGSGTTVDHIEVYYGKDDAFEFFGGTVNCSYLLAYAQEDDGLDFDKGYQGTINYAIIISDLAASHAPVKTDGGHDSNAIESDSHSGSETLITKPVLNHITIVGAKNNNTWNTTLTNNGGLLYGARFRKATQFDMQNSIIIGYPVAVSLEAGAAESLLGQGALVRSLGPIVKKVQTYTFAYTRTTGVVSTSVFKNNYVQSFSNLQSTIASGSTTASNYSGITDLFTTGYGVAQFYTSATDFLCTVNEVNNTNSNLNTANLNKPVFVQPFVNATGAVNLNFAKGGAIAAAKGQGHLALTNGLKPTWGKNWTAGVYGF